MEKENFYIELIKNIETKIEQDKINEALILINEEMEMPYIPLKIEKKLLQLKKIVDASIFNLNYNNLTLEKITNLIRNKDLQQSDKLELLNLLQEFNLKNELIFELLKTNDVAFLIKLKILSLLKKQTSFKDLDVIINDRQFLVSETDLFDIETNINFKNDANKIQEYLFKDIILLNSSLDLLEKYYFVEYFNDKNVGDIWKEVIFIIGKLFENNDVQNQILNLSDMKINIFEAKILKILNLSKY